LGDSTVNLELRIWINDAKNGLANVKSKMLLKIWDAFHANGIQFVFPSGICTSPVPYRWG